MGEVYMKIDIIPAVGALTEKAVGIIHGELAPRLAGLKDKHGEELGGLMLSHEIGYRLAAAEKAAAEGLAFVAESGGRPVGFVSVSEAKNSARMGNISCLAGENDEIRAALQSFALNKLSEHGRSFIQMRAFIDGFAGVFTRGLPAVEYFMELSDWEEGEPNENVIFVPIVPEHSEDIRKIAIAGWTPIRKSQKALIGEEFYSVKFENWEENKGNSILNRAFSGDPDICCFSAVADGRIAGFLTSRIDASGEQLLTVCDNCVSPEFAGKGIGSSMYRRIIAEAKNRGARYAAVETGLDVGHAPARRAYEKAGFTRSIAVETVTYCMII